jgi:hypothetical protein
MAVQLSELRTIHPKEIPRPNSTQTRFLRVHFNTSLMPQQVHVVQGTDTIPGWSFLNRLEERP